MFSFTAKNSRAASRCIRHFGPRIHQPRISRPRINCGIVQGRHYRLFIKAEGNGVRYTELAPSNYRKLEHPDYASDKSYDGDSQWELRELMNRYHHTKWGFPIVRCTYNSQSQWEKYVSCIHADIHKFLEHEFDRPLRETLEIPIIEDKGRLDGATWKEARAKFDEWSFDELRATIGGIDDSWKDPALEMPLSLALHSNQRWGFCIYADQASVESVVNCDDESEQMREGTFFEDDNGCWMKDYEGDEESAQTLRQKFKVYDFVPLYVSVPTRWPELYAVREDGISEVW